MNKYLLATGVLVLVAAMCIPISVFSDGSDAFEITLIILQFTLYCHDFFIFRYVPTSVNPSG